jgi:hypothetical protein
MQQGSEVGDKLDQAIAPAYMGPLMGNDDPEHVGRQSGYQRGRNVDYGPRQACGERERGCAVHHSYASLSIIMADGGERI